MFQQTPVYDRLVAERGDIPVQVREEADRIRRDLAEVLPEVPIAQPSAPQDLFAPEVSPTPDEDTTPVPATNRVSWFVRSLRHLRR